MMIPTSVSFRPCFGQFGISDLGFLHFGFEESASARLPLLLGLGFRCKGCKKDFTITSGTLFASYKLPLRRYQAAIAVFCNEVKGKSALALSRDLGLTFRSNATARLVYFAPSTHWPETRYTPTCLLALSKMGDVTATRPNASLQRASVSNFSVVIFECVPAPAPVPTTIV